MHTSTGARNLLKNSSFEDGVDAPDGWEWVVVSGRPIWAFDAAVHCGHGRSVKIIQDVGNVHGEFRQTVPCVGGKRYLLRGRIRVAIEGTGDDSGASFCLASLKVGSEIGRMSFRPFFVGREDWQLWSLAYVTPKDADALVVSFDMRRSDGVAWFDELELFEAPAKLEASVRPPVLPAACVDMVRRAKSVRVLCDETPSFFVNDVLMPLLGAAHVKVSPFKALEGEIDEDAVIVYKRVPGRPLDLAMLSRIARTKPVILTPAAFASAAKASGVSAHVVESDLGSPCAKIEKECFLTRGLRRGDVIPWWSASGPMGRQVQVQTRADRTCLAMLGFETIAASACGWKDADGHAVILRRAGGRGIVVMDLEPLNTRPAYGADSNLACLVLSNALGRPQASLGTYVVPASDYQEFTEDLLALAAAHPGLELKEEGRSHSGKPVYSLSVGAKDAPVFFADAGIHPYEWAPCYGLALYAARLADEFRKGLPWARALLSKLRFKCVPVYAPDGWEDRVRGQRGVNLNRNFPVYWDRYAGDGKGAQPLSEPETRVVADILRRENVVAAVSWHETSANTNWVGAPGWRGRYAGYDGAIGAFFKQCIDGNHFYWQAAVWTQVTDPRNFHYHYTDSYPYLRDYSLSMQPFQLHYSDSLGIRSFLVEQYGNSEMYFSATPQRTDMTGRIVEMLLGFEIGLVCRNHGAEALDVSIPLSVAGKGAAAVYTSDGKRVSAGTVKADAGVVTAQGTIPPGGCLVVELDQPLWKRRPRRRLVRGTSGGKRVRKS